MSGKDYLDRIFSEEEFESLRAMLQSPLIDDCNLAYEILLAQNLRTTIQGIDVINMLYQGPRGMPPGTNTHTVRREWFSWRDRILDKYYDR